MFIVTVSKFHLTADLIFKSTQTAGVGVNDSWSKKERRERWWRTDREKGRQRDRNTLDLLVRDHLSLMTLHSFP